MQHLLGGKALRLSLKGLNYMSDDPTDMHVLYLKVRWELLTPKRWTAGLTAGQVGSEFDV